ncbi:probable galacturonosyltransferase 4 [Oryza glaberrima]|uniref:probable galacturonosyltransferase 4 n=1 Tax=Oryza glaberrima TaxID=4538 RepID=UPI00224C0081|nr:probable galacturonosyltransferase 4 [Oryza glaberrima]
MATMASAAAASASARRWRWRWKWRTRDAVLALLIASVLAPPLLLYGGAPIAPFSGPILMGSAASGLDLSNLIARKEVRERLNALKQDAFAAVKEPIQTVASDAAALKAGLIQHIVDQSSGIDRGTKDNGMVASVNKKGGVEFTKENGLIDDGKLRQNKVRAMRNSSGLNITLNKDHTADRPPEKTTDTTSEDSDIRAISNNTSHSTASPDSTIRVLRDQLKRARTYIGFLSSRGNHGFIKDLRRRMRDIQQALSGATNDKQLPKNVHGRIREMELTLTKVKQVHENCAAIISKLQATLHSTEEQMQAHKQEANYVTQIAAKALPKRLNCLAMRLTNEYYSSSSSNKHFPYEEKLEDPKLQHYALFSDNVLGAAVVVNSTIIHAKTPENHVFHIVTDKLNYAAMRMWFLENSQGKAAIEVQNIEDFTWLNSSYSPVLKQLESQFMINYYFKTQQDKRDNNPKFQNPKYLSILNHLRFYLPEIFPKLNKVLFLDDDIVVQQDLSALWSIDLKGKVNGAIQTCGETFHRFDRYLNFSNPLIAKNFERRACGWAYGMNMFDLSEWRKRNITDVYHYWQEQNEHRLLWKLGTLPAGLVTFWNQTFPLDHKWHLLGLGYKPNVNQKDIEGAAVIHYNGNRKPWLEIAMAKYRKYWSKYVNFDNVFIRQCNIHP